MTQTFKRRKPKTERFGLRLCPDLLALLNRRAEKLSMTKTQVIERALTAYLALKP